MNDAVMLLEKRFGVGNFIFKPGPYECGTFSLGHSVE
jgi:hypothetical protein